MHEIKRPPCSTPLLGHFIHIQQKSKLKTGTFLLNVSKALTTKERKNSDSISDNLASTGSNFTGRIDRLSEAAVDRQAAKCPAAAAIEVATPVEPAAYLASLTLALRVSAADSRHAGNACFQVSKLPAILPAHIHMCAVISSSCQKVGSKAVQQVSIVEIRSVQ